MLCLEAFRLFSTELESDYGIDFTRRLAFLPAIFEIALRSCYGR